MGYTGAQGWVSYSLPPSSSNVFGSDRFPLLSREPRQISSSPRGSDPNAPKASNRVSRTEHSGVLQSPISGKESVRNMETSSGRLQTERLCNKDQILHGDQSVGPSVHSEGRLDGLHGHEGCLFSYPHPSRVQEVPKVQFRLESIPVQGTVLRAQHSPSGLYQSTGPSGKDCTSGRVQNSIVSGRLVNNRKVQSGGVEGERVCAGTSSEPRDSHKQGKILFSSKPDSRVFRYDNKLQPFLGFTLGETSRIRHRNLGRISVLQREASKGLAKLARSFIFPGKVCARSPTKDETSSVSPKQNVEQGFTTDLDSHSVRPQGRVVLVGTPREDSSRPVSSQGEPKPEVIFRRLKGRLGCHDRRAPHLREMVSRGQTLSYKHTRTEGHLVGSSGGSPFSIQPNSSCLLRQHDSPVVSSETGRHKVLVPVPTCAGNNSLVGNEQNRSDPPVHSRDEELSGGCIEQERADITHRVDSAPGGVSTALEEVGPAYGGPLCHQSHKEASAVYGSPLRPDGDCNRRYVAKLVQHGRLCFSSVRHGSSGSEQVYAEHQLQTYSNSPLVATKGVVPGPSGLSNRGTQTASSKTGPVDTAPGKGKTSKPPHASSSRMETMQRLTKHREFSSIVSKSIYEARKPSTNSLYQKRWATFVQWCRTHKCSASRPSINSICEFFIYLFEVKGLVVNTIRCYRSTLHSVLRHTGLKINRNQDIADVMRSLRLRAPVLPSRLVNWNLDVLLKFLCSDKFEPISNCSLFNLTKKTFILMALALSKRVSELQALSRSVGFCSEGAVVSLAMDFRAKNDFKCKNLQRNFVVKELGSLVGQEEEALLCPVRALKAYLDRTKPLVGKNMSRLFVSPRYPTNPASKNALTAMTKAVIKEAHESLRPDLIPVLKVKVHELRGVSTSMSFHHNLSLTAVLEAAQWRCHSVFASHYLKDVSLVYEDCRTLGPLLMAGSVIT